MKEENDDPIAALLRLAGPRPRVSEERAARVRAAVHGEWQRGVEARARTRRIGMYAAAAAVAAIAILLFVPRTSVAPLPATPAATVAFVQTPRGTTPVAARTWIETSSDGAMSLEWNGATLRIDRATRVRIDSPRLVTLERGAVYFSSDGRKAGAVIRTPLGAVRDIGTQFEVRVQDERVHVRVREGRVDFANRAVADAGTELIANLAGIERKTIAVSGPEWEWIASAAPPLPLEGLTLRDAISRIAREKGLRVRWGDGVDGTIRLHGRTAFTIDEALDAATAASGVTYRIQNDTLIIGRSH